MDNAKITQFKYQLEEIRQDLLTDLSLLPEFDRTFRGRAENAAKKGNDGFFIRNHEFECAVKLYNSIHADLLVKYQVLISAMNHQEVQKIVLETHIKKLNSKICELEKLIGIDKMITEIQEDWAARKSA